MTTFLLIRHAVHDWVDRMLVGRTPDVGLGSVGLRQAQRLAERLAHERITRVQASPQLRTRQTAKSIARAYGFPVEIVPAIDEVDMGAWTGRSFDDLADDPLWHRWNSTRGAARIPGGESMREVQDRMADHIARMAGAHPNGRIALVSHAEPIRALILHYRRIPLDDFARVRVDPASVTTLRVLPSGGRIIAENEDVDARVSV